MQRGFVSLVLTLILALAGLFFSACSPVEQGRRVSTMTVQQHRHDVGKRPARGTILREHRPTTTAPLSWDDDDDDDDDELVPPLDTGAAPDDDDAAEGPVQFAANALTLPPAESRGAEPWLVLQTAPPDPPRSIEVPPPRRA